MATPSEKAVDQLLSVTDTRVRVGGGLLAIGSVFVVVGFLLHPSVSGDQSEFVATIAENSSVWAVAHGVVAVGLAAFTVAGLLLLTAETRLVEHWWTMVAWPVLVVSALLVTTAAIVEGTVIAEAAVDGDTATFETWTAYTDVLSAVFLVFLLSVAVVAGNEARSAVHATPVWASWLAVLAAVVSAAGMVTVFVLEVGAAFIVWQAATTVTGLWTLWFGLVLARSGGVDTAVREETEAGGRGAV